jgi:hypothetical protein
MLSVLPPEMGIAPSNDLVARWRYHRPQIETPYSNKPMIFYGWQAGGLDYVFRTETLKAEKPRQYPVALRLQLEPRDPDSVDVLRSIAVSGTIDGQVAGSVSIVVRSETTVPAEKTAAVKVATVKASTVKTAAVKSSAMKTSAPETSAPETSAMGLGSSNTDWGVSAIATTAAVINSLRVMGTLLFTFAIRFRHRTYRKLSEATLDAKIS